MKRVLTISSHRDIIKEDYEGLLKKFTDGVVKIKHTKKAKSFALLKIDMETIGILWFRSKDYFINDVCKVFEFYLSSDLEKSRFSIGQARKIIDIFNLNKPQQIYFRYVLGDNLEEDFSKLEQLIKEISFIDICMRLQIDFSNENIVLANKIQLASRLSTLGQKYGIKINSCRFSDFATKNIWVGSEPCLSGYVMQGLLDMKMMKVPQDSSVCPCHKNTDIYGCGEMFREGIDKVRSSDLNRGKLDKIKKVSDKTVTARVQKNIKKTSNKKKSVKIVEKELDTSGIDLFL